MYPAAPTMTCCTSWPGGISTFMAGKSPTISCCPFGGGFSDRWINALAPLLTVTTVWQVLLIFADVISDVCPLKIWKGRLESVARLFDPGKRCQSITRPSSSPVKMISRLISMVVTTASCPFIAMLPSMNMRPSEFLSNTQNSMLQLFAPPVANI